MVRQEEEEEKEKVDANVTRENVYTVVSNDSS